MEKDDEVKGEGNSYTTEFRQYDPRLGRWLTLDPLMAKYPHQSGYCSFNNNPIFFADPTGLEGEAPSASKRQQRKADNYADKHGIDNFRLESNGNMTWVTGSGYQDASVNTHNVGSGGIFNKIGNFFSAIGNAVESGLRYLDNAVEKTRGSQYQNEGGIVMKDSPNTGDKKDVKYSSKPWGSMEWSDFQDLMTAIESLKTANDWLSEPKMQKTMDFNEYAKSPLGKSYYQQNKYPNLGRGTHNKIKREGWETYKTTVNKYNEGVRSSWREQKNSSLVESIAGEAIKSGNGWNDNPALQNGSSETIYDKNGWILKYGTDSSRYHISPDDGDTIFGYRRVNNGYSTPFICPTCD
jgi:RHS repeat-associated protein